MWYSFNVNSFVSNYVFIKKIRFIDFCQSLLFHINKTHSNIFSSFYGKTMDRTKWNSQIAVLEQILNEEYGYIYDIDIVNSIYIIDYISGMNINYMYNESEAQPLYLYNENEGQPVYFYNEIEYNIPMDFIIYMPIGSDETKLKSIVNELKLIDKKYIIKKY